MFITLEDYIFIWLNVMRVLILLQKLLLDVNVILA